MAKPGLSFHRFHRVVFQLSLVTSVLGRNLYGDRVCGTLFSETNLVGSNFVLMNGDQTVSMKRDYRSLIDGWGNTSSIRVEENCKLSACTGTYYEGNCQSYLPGNHIGTEGQRLDVQSASCTCTRDCKCEDVIIYKNSNFCGRAYVNGSCSSCDSQYIQLRYASKSWSFPSDYKDSVTAIAIRSGCTLTVYKETNPEGESRVITRTVVQDFQGRVGRYQCKCDDNAYNPPPHSTTIDSVPFSLSLPSSSDDLLEMIISNVTLAEHPGILAAKASLLSGRSNLNAYILLIGVDYPVYSGFFWDCHAFYNKISECHVALRVPEIGIPQVRLRVIWAPMDSRFGSGPQWAATLDKYLSTHEELKDSIPNAVIVLHDDMDDITIAETGSKFQNNLAAVNALRGRILDENYSNLVFAVKDKNRIRNPESKIVAFKAAINKNRTFPKPNVVLPTYDYDYAYDIPKNNGQMKLTSAAYFYQNIYNALLMASQKSDDALGYAIFKAAFPLAETEWQFLSKNNTDLLPENDVNVNFHKQLASDPERLAAFLTQSALPRAQKVTTVPEKIHKLRGEQQHLKNQLYLKMVDLEEENKAIKQHIQDISYQRNATTVEVENLKKEIQNISSQNTVLLKETENLKLEHVALIRHNNATIIEIESLKQQIQDLMSLNNATLKEMNNLKHENRVLTTQTDAKILSETKRINDEIWSAIRLNLNEIFE